jgi:hypothetical protein
MLRRRKIRTPLFFCNTFAQGQIGQDQYRNRRPEAAAESP